MFSINLKLFNASLISEMLYFEDGTFGDEKQALRGTKNLIGDEQDFKLSKINSLCEDPEEKLRAHSFSLVRKS